MVYEDGQANSVGIQPLLSRRFECQFPEHDVDYYIRRCGEGLRIDHNTRSIHPEDVDEFVRRADQVRYICPEHDPGWEHLR